MCNSIVFIIEEGCVEQYAKCFDLTSGQVVRFTDIDGYNLATLYGTNIGQDLEWRLSYCGKQDVKIIVSMYEEGLGALWVNPKEIPTDCSIIELDPKRLVKLRTRMSGRDDVVWEDYSVDELVERIKEWINPGEIVSIWADVDMVKLFEVYCNGDREVEIKLINR